MDYKLVVIGSGPGGYVAAIRASQLGMKTAVIERAEIGGICLNWGCIPTKALMKSVEVLEYAQSAAKYGIKVENVSADFQKVIQRSRTVAKQVSKGVEYLLKKNNIDLIRGHGRIVDANTVAIDLEDGSTKKITSEYIIIATGAKSRQLPHLIIDGTKVIGYRQALAPEKQPKSLLIVGSGATGVELAVFYATMGTEVHLVEILPRILPNEDEDVSAEVEKLLKRKRIKIYTSSSVEGYNETLEGLEVKLSTPDGEKLVTVEKIFLAVGISPNIENIGLTEVGIEVEKNRIKVDQYYRTTVPNIFAIGDVIPTPALAHVASAEGITAVEFIAGLNPKPIDYSKIPAGVFLNPQIASVGLREHQAKEQGIDYIVGKFPISALGKATAIGQRDGFVKLIFDRKTDKLLGAHIVAPNATDMIAELVIAMNIDATSKQIIKSIHPHPTISEAIMEAAEAAYGHAIHI